MVIEVNSRPGWGGLKFSLDFEEDSLTQPRSLNEPSQGPKIRPWCFIEASPSSQLYLPSLSPLFRKAAAEGKLLWIKPPEDLAPGIAHMVLESGLCEGVMIRGLDAFSKSTPAALWGRRWQLAAHKGGSHLLWVHEKHHAVIGFDVRLEWTAPGSFEIRKGYGHFNNDRLKNIATHHTAA